MEDAVEDVVVVDVKIVWMDELELLDGSVPVLVVVCDFGRRWASELRHCPWSDTL